MEYGWPQYVYIALICIGVLMEANKHGKPKTGTHDVVTTIIASAIIIAILRAGGFF